MKTKQNNNIKTTLKIQLDFKQAATFDENASVPIQIQIIVIL